MEEQLLNTSRKITLRIKSASHKFAEDMELNQVTMSSTVKQVKELIQANYPFHPEIKEQRLIYSGHILKDEQVLADFLIPNTDGGDESYVIHLSCTSSFTRRENEANTAAKSSPGSTAEVKRSAVEQLYMDSMGRPNHADLLANNTTAMQQNELAALHQQYLNQMLGFMSQWNGGFGPGGPNMMMMPPPPQPNPQFSFHVPNFEQNIHQGPPPPFPAPLQQQQQAGDAPVAAAPQPAARRAARADDEDGQQQDMLDWIYTLSRVALIFSVVYFYSNLTRLVLVILFTGFVFLLQRRQGAARQQQQDNNNVVPPPVVQQPNAPPAAAQAQDAGAPANVNPPGAVGVNNNNDSNNQQQPQAPENELRRRTPANENVVENNEGGVADNSPAVDPSIPPEQLAPEPVRITVWQFVTAFVTSLIPDMAQHQL